MKRIISIIFTVTLVLSMWTTATFAEGSLDEVISDNQTKVEQSTDKQTPKNDTKTTEKNSSFIKGLNDATDLSADTEGASKITSGAKKAVGFVVQILCYFITILLVLRVVLDIAYLVIPFTRKWLSNGFTGNAQAGAPNQTPMGGLGMGGGLNGGLGNGFGGGLGMGQGMGGLGMGGGLGMQRPMGMASPAGAQQTAGKIQLVSNAALNAAAGESVVGPDGKTVGPFRIYIKDMIVVLVVTPILLTLAVTGVLTDLGLQIGALLVDAIRGLKDMI